MQMQAIFKPRAQGDFDGWHRTPIERVAYLLNLQLGMDLVPPTVYRHDLVLENQSFSQDGAMIYFVDEMTDLMETNERDWGISKESLLSDTRILVRHLRSINKCMGCVHVAGVNEFEDLCRTFCCTTVIGIVAILDGASIGHRTRNSQF